MSSNVWRGHTNPLFLDAPEFWVHQKKNLASNFFFLKSKNETTSPRGTLIFSTLSWILFYEFSIKFFYLIVWNFHSKETGVWHFKLKSHFHRHKKHLFSFLIKHTNKAIIDSLTYFVSKLMESVFQVLYNFRFTPLQTLHNDFTMR